MAATSSADVHVLYFSKYVLKTESKPDVQYGKSLYWPIDLPECTTPAEATQEGLCVLVESRDVESSGEGLHAVESPRLTIICWVGCNEIWHCSWTSALKNAV